MAPSGRSSSCLRPTGLLRKPATTVPTSRPKPPRSHATPRHTGRPFQVGVIRTIAGHSRQQATRIAAHLDAAETASTEIPVALPTPLSNPDSHSPPFAALVDATATYPLPAAQLASLAGLPLLTILEDRGGKHVPSSRRPSPAIAVLATGRGPRTIDTTAPTSARIVHIRDIATQSVTITPSVHNEHSPELISMDLFHPEPASEIARRRVAPDATLTIRMNESNLVITHTCPGLGPRRWTVDEVTITGLSGEHAVTLDSAEPGTQHAPITLRRLDARQASQACRGAPL